MKTYGEALAHAVGNHINDDDTRYVEWVVAKAQTALLSQIYDLPVEQVTADYFGLVNDMTATKAADLKNARAKAFRESNEERRKANLARKTP